MDQSKNKTVEAYRRKYGVVAGGIILRLKATVAARARWGRKTNV